jgi:hypothetical protein
MCNRSVVYTFVLPWNLLTRLRKGINIFSGFFKLGRHVCVFPWLTRGEIAILKVDRSHTYKYKEITNDRNYDASCTLTSLSVSEILSARFLLHRVYMFFALISMLWSPNNNLYLTRVVSRFTSQTDSILFGTVTKCSFSFSEVSPWTLSLQLTAVYNFRTSFHLFSLVDTSSLVLSTFIPPRITTSLTLSNPVESQVFIIIRSVHLSL